MRLKEFIDFLEDLEVDNSEISELNELFESELDKTFASPESGLLAVHKALQNVNQDILTPYEIVSEGDELVLEMKNGLFLYLIYAPTEDGNYELYAEAGDEELMEELLSEGEEEE